MNRRDFLRTAGLGLAALSLPACRSTSAEQPASAPAAAGGKPNIIFILSDAVGLGDIGCYGSDHFKTPNIDALARGGTRFEYNYAMPLCGPSRCLAMTGRYPFRTGLINNQSPNAINPGREVMIPTVMKKAGYVTASVGKWGQMCLDPGAWGFDTRFTFSIGVQPQGAYSVSAEESVVVPLPVSTFTVRPKPSMVSFDQRVLVVVVLVAGLTL